MYDLYIYYEIAKYNVQAFFAMMSIPCFARDVIKNNWKFADKFLIVKIHPAFVYENILGTFYYLNEKLHRFGDNPAIIYDDGSLSYYKNSQVHRGNDKPASISMTLGTIVYWEYNKPHRKHNPAVLCKDGYIEYYNKGNRTHFERQLNHAIEYNKLLETYLIPKTS